MLFRLGRAAKVLLPTAEGSEQDVAQDAELLFGETAQALGRLEKTVHQLVDDLPSVLGQDDALDPSVVLGVAARDEAARLEPIDDAGDVGGVAPERLGDARHRARGTVLQKR